MPEESMMPQLPGFGDEVMPASGASFNDRILLLLAAVARAEGVLTYPEYELTADIVRRIFGERALYAGMQARFHYALLHPPTQVEELAATLAREAVEEKVSARQIQALLDGLDELCRRREQVGDMARQLREAIDIAFGQERLNQRSRRLAGEGWLSYGLEQGARLGVNMGRAAVGGTLSLMQGMAGTARKMLSPVLEPLLGQEPVDKEAAFVPRVAARNLALAGDVDALGRAVWSLRMDEVRRELNDFRKILADQPFKVVVVGEGKRGKSSLVNAILGEALTPVRESAPETATIAEFYYAAQPEYAIRFLGEEAYEHLEAYLAGEEDNLLLRAKVEQMRAAYGGERPKGLFTLASKADIPDYLGAEGRFSALVSKVRIGLPVPILAGGMILADTPGLNATDSFHDYLAYEESLTADCLVVVLDARRPDSASELRLLRKLAASGRAVSIIGVMTGIDRLNAADSLDTATERAMLVLREAVRGARQMRVLGLVPLNARQAMEQRCFPETVRHAADTEARLDQFMELLRTALASDEGSELYRAKVAERAESIVALAREHSHQAFESYRASLPQPQFLELLERHAEQLGAAAATLSEQARSVVASAAHEVEEWRIEQQAELDAWEELLVLRVMDAARRHADALGSDFAKEGAWKDFDATEAPRIARQSLDEFLSRQQDKLHAWNEKLRLFSEEIRELSVLCLQAVEHSANELGDICAMEGGMDHILVRTNAHMRNLAVFLAGAGAGSALAGSLLNLMALGSAAVMLVTNPIVLPGVALIGVAAYALQALGNPEKRKAAFLEKKRKKVEQWALEARSQLEAELAAAREELAAAYKNAVARGFVPALEILTGEAVHLRLYLQVMDTIRDDTTRFEASLDTLLNSMATRALEYHPDAQ